MSGEQSHSALVIGDKYFKELRTQVHIDMGHPENSGFLSGSPVRFLCQGCLSKLKRIVPHLYETRRPLYGNGGNVASMPITRAIRESFAMVRNNVHDREMRH